MLGLRGVVDECPSCWSRAALTRSAMQPTGQCHQRYVWCSRNAYAHYRLPKFCFSLSACFLFALCLLPHMRTISLAKSCAIAVFLRPTAERGWTHIALRRPSKQCALCSASQSTYAASYHQCSINCYHHCLLQRQSLPRSNHRRYDLKSMIKPISGLEALNSCKNGRPRRIVHPYFSMTTIDVVA